MSEKQTITVKLTPGARQNKVMGWDEDLLGECTLKICVTAIPEKGKANKAMIALLSKYWKIPKSEITIVRGATSRVKLLEVDGVITSA